MRSSKELSLDKKIIRALETIRGDEATDTARTAPAETAPLATRGVAGTAWNVALEAAKLILSDEEIQAAQEYANTVSIVRLGFNDHGPVHMRTVVLNAIIMMSLLREAGIKTSLETEGVGGFEDSLTAVIFAAMLHDLGMTISRQDHEIHSAYQALPIMDRLLSKLYPGDMQKKVMIRSLALEGIAGHMGNRPVHSLEAGVVQVADGCDMTKGRARIPISLGRAHRAGHIHQYSANSIKEVRLSRGAENPIRIEVLMTSEVGLFQVEEVLLAKIAASTAKPFIELYALVDGGEPKRYL